VVAVALLLGAMPAAGITFGEVDETNAYANVGALIAEFDGEKYVICSGTLIAADVFLTAAHCTIGLEDVWVSFDLDIDEPVTTGLHPGTPVTHPSFGAIGGGSDWHDIAVVLLDEAPGMAPAPLPPAGLLDEMKADKSLRDATFTAVGYGVVRDDKTGGFHPLFWDGQRRYADQTLLSLQQTVLGLSMQPSTGDGGTCYGDSGGPHFLGDLVVSITVTGDAPCRASDKTYRLDSASARAFLDPYVDLP
jgi:hypothetical protein